MTDREVATISREDLEEKIDQGDEFVLVDTSGRTALPALASAGGH